MTSLAKSTLERLEAHLEGFSAALRDQLQAAVHMIDEKTAEALKRIEIHAPDEMGYQEAAAYLSTTRRTLERRVKQRRIAYRKEGARVLFTRAALDEYRASLTRPARNL